MKTKVCRKCGKRKSLDEFYKNKSRNTIETACKVCRLAYMKELGKTEHHKNTRKKYKETEAYKISQRKASFKRKYNLSLDQHSKMYVKQNGCCLICKRPVNYEKIHTDHNHISGKIRGLLCRECNLGLGYFFVDEKGTEILSQAVKYIKQQNKVKGN